MGVRTWSYDPDRCDGQPCISNCYQCPLAVLDDDHFPIEAILAMWVEKQKEQKDERD